MCKQLRNYYLYFMNSTTFSNACNLGFWRGRSKIFSVLVFLKLIQREKSLVKGLRGLGDFKLEVWPLIQRFILFYFNEMLLLLIVDVTRVVSELGGLEI